jgi:hypothetical protein
MPTGAPCCVNADCKNGCCNGTNCGDKSVALTCN